MDPNKIVKPGAVETAWITPDGTYITTDPAEAKKNGATHQVAASKATYADGRRQWIVYTGPDRSLAEGTYSPAGPVAGYDEETQRSWQQQQAGAQRQQDQAERKRVSVTYEGSGASRKRRTVYESGPDLVEDAPETATNRRTNTVTQGTPIRDANGNITGWDNEQPREVVTDAETGEVISSKPLEGPKLDDWREARERSRNPGNKTDAQLATERKEADAKAEQGRPTVSTQTVTRNGQSYTVHTSTPKDGSRPTITVFGPDGKEVPGGLPAETKQAGSKTITRNGKTYVEHVVPKPDGTNDVYHTDQNGNRVTLPDEGNQPIPAGMPAFRPDPNKPSFGLVEYAGQLAALRSQGSLTDKQYAEFVTQAHQMATSEAGRLDTIRSAQQQQQANAINQRNADQQASVSRLNAANTATQNALTTSQQMAGNFTPKSYAAMGGPLYSAVAAAQDARALGWGGMERPPPIGVESYPLLAQLRGMGMGTPSVPTVEQILQSGRPNALGVGAVPGAITPGATPSDPLAAPSPTAAAAAPTPPPPPVVAPSSPVVAPRAVAPPMAAPVPVVAPPVRDDYMHPGTGDPGTELGRPGDPGYMAPIGAGGGNVQMAPPAILPGVLQAGIMSELSGRYPPDVLAEAARSLGWA